MTLPSHPPLQVLNERRCGEHIATQGLKRLMIFSCLFVVVFLLFFCYSKKKADCVFGRMHMMCSCFIVPYMDTCSIYI